MSSIQAENTGEKLPSIAVISELVYKGKTKTLTHTLDGTRTLSIDRSEAQLIDGKTRKSIGNTFRAKAAWSPSHLFTFTCFTFTPDGKYVITGSSFIENSNSRDGIGTNLGIIQLWDLASGKMLADLSKGIKLGAVRNISLNEDGATVVYAADQYSIDGK